MVETTAKPLIEADMDAKDYRNQKELESIDKRLNALAVLLVKVARNTVGVDDGDVDDLLEAFNYEIGE